jgi:hypothetical protein
LEALTISTAVHPWVGAQHFRPQMRPTKGSKNTKREIAEEQWSQKLQKAKNRSAEKSLVIGVVVSK